MIALYANLNTSHTDVVASPDVHQPSEQLDVVYLPAILNYQAFEGPNFTAVSRVAI